MTDADELLDELVRSFDERCRVLCLTCAGSVISGYRSPAHNAAVGGHEYSLHCAFLARDITFANTAGRARAERECERLGLHYKVNSERTLHVQALPPIE